MSETTPDPADVHTGTDRVELTDAEKWLIPHLTQLDAAADARDVYAAVGSIVAARVQALTTEDRTEPLQDALNATVAQRDAARAELASANARCAELEAQKVADHETWLQEVEERDAMLIERDATLDRVTALADEPHEELRSAIAEVYRRHDSNAPLNHVNNVEWVEAVESVLRAALTPEGKE